MAHRFLYDAIRHVQWTPQEWLIDARLFALALLLVDSAARAQTPVDPPLPAGAIARFGDWRYVQPDVIHTVAMSPDGKSIATTGRDCLCLWDADTGRRTHTIDLPKDLRQPESTAFSRDGRRVAIGSAAYEIGVFDVGTGKSIWTPASRGTSSSPPRQFHRGVTALHFLRNDELLAIELDYPDVQVWDVRTGKMADSPYGSNGVPYPTGYESRGVSLSPSGALKAWLAVPGSVSRQADGNVVFVCDTITGKLVSSLKHVEEKGERLSFGKGIRLLDEGKTVMVDGRVLGMDDGKERVHIPYRLSHFMGRPNGERFELKITVPPDGKTFFAWDEVGLRHWDARTGQVLGNIDAYSQLAFAADADRAVGVYRQRLTVCDRKLVPIRETSVWSGPPSVEFESNERLTLLGVEHSEVWDLPARKLVKATTRKVGGRPKTERLPTSTDRDGKLFVYHDGKSLVLHDVENNRKLFSLEGTKLGPDESPYAFIPSLTENGNRVLVASAEEKHVLVRWFDTRDGKEIGRYRIPHAELHPNELPTVTVRWLSDDGAEFRYVRPDRRLAVVDCAAGKVNRTIGLAWSLAASSKSGQQLAEWDYERSSGFLLASRTIDSEKHSMEYAIFDLPTGRLRRRFSIDSVEREPVLTSDGRFMAILFGYDSKRTNELAIYETATGSLRGTIRAPLPISDLALSPNGRMAALSCRDTSVYVWDLDRPLDPPEGRKLPRVDVDSADRDAIWRTLDDRNAAVADPVLHALMRAPRAALGLFEARLKPVLAPSTERTEKLIADLSDPNFRIRNEAARALTELNELSLPILRKRVAEGSIEQRRFLEGLIDKLERVDSSVSPAELRAIAVLERLDDPRARRLLEAIAAGAEEAALTQDARMALRRSSPKKQ
jgi:WD40 repeat protein